MGDRIAAASPPRLLPLLLAVAGWAGAAEAQVDLSVWSAAPRAMVGGEIAYVMPNLPVQARSGQATAPSARGVARPSEALANVLDLGSDPRGSALAAPADESELPARPGAFKPDAVRIPGHFHKDPKVTSRVGKDVELLTRNRTTLGVFGEVGPAKPGVVNPGWRDRELGGGVTLQYRFGTR